MKVLRTTKETTENVKEVETQTREEQVREGISKIEAILEEYQITFDSEITINSKGNFTRVVVVDKTLQVDQN